MSVFDDLGTVFGVRPPVGYRACRREALPNHTVEELDAMVEALDGARIVRESKPSGQVGGGRMMPRVQEVSYYLIPESAFDT